MDCGLSVEHYNIISRKVNTCGVRIMPGYARVANAKQDCRPQRGIVIRESCARAEIQPLLEHTLKRALESQGTHLDKFFATRPRRNCSFLCAYGFDSSTGQSMWHKAFRNTPHLNEMIRPDHSVVFVCLNPLKVIDDSDGAVLWENPARCSSRPVRPIMLEFAKETAEYTRQYVRLQMFVESNY